MQDVQKNLDSNKAPGLNDDPLGSGSVQSSLDWGSGMDQPFWDAVKSKVKNLHALVSGHGKQVSLSTIILLSDILPLKS